MKHKINLAKNVNRFLVEDGRGVIRLVLAQWHKGVGHKLQKLGLAAHVVDRKEV